jgi:hypothetical protein
VVAASAVWARDRGSGHDAGSACEHATPIRKVQIAGRSTFVARITNFDIAGTSAPPNRVATYPLYPRYPTALLVGGIGIAARHRLTAPVVLSASYCEGGRVGLFSFVGTKSGPAIPRPAPASVVRRTGSARVTLFWPPPIEGPPDKPKWLLTLYLYKPGLAVVRFAQGGRVIDRLTVKVCRAGGPRLTCT